MEVLYFTLLYQTLISVKVTFLILMEGSLKINESISSLKQSSTLLINERVKELRKEGHHINHWGFGQSPFPIHATIVEELKKNARNNHYLPVAGLEVLRSRIADFLATHQNVKASKQNILVGPGSKELLYQSILIFEGEFLIPRGSWVSYVPQIQSKGAVHHVVPTQFCNDFKLTPQDIEQFFSTNPTDPKSKQLILILNSPNNPTGAVYTEQEYQNLAQTLKKYRIIVFSDEIYSQLNFKQPFSPSISVYYPERTIVFGGLSKVFSAGGYRMGFMALPETFKSLMTVYKSLSSETFSCVCSPVQYAAIRAFQFSEEIQVYIKRQSSILEKVSSFIFEKLSEVGVECTRPSGAFYMVIGFNRFKGQINKLGIKSSFELAQYVLQRYKCAMLPGADFGFEDDDLFFRVAFVDFDGEQVLQAMQSNQEIDVAFLQKQTPNIVSAVASIRQFLQDLQ